MSGATTDGDRLRLALDQIQAAHISVDRGLLLAITRLAQWSLTGDEAEIVTVLITARGDLSRARNRLAKLHPDYCEKPTRNID